MEKLLSGLISYGTAVFWGAVGLALENWWLTAAVLIFLLLAALRILFREFLRTMEKRPS